MKIFLSRKTIGDGNITGFIKHPATFHDGKTRICILLCCVFSLAAAFSYAAFAEVGYGISNPFELSYYTAVAKDRENVRPAARPSMIFTTGETLRIKITGGPYSTAALHDLAGRKIAELAGMVKTKGSVCTLCLNSGFIKAHGLQTGAYFIVLCDKTRKNKLTQKIILSK